MHFVVRTRPPHICQASLFCSGNIAFCSLTAVHPEGCSYKNGSQLHHGNSQGDAQVVDTLSKGNKKQIKKIEKLEKVLQKAKWPFTGINTAYILFSSIV